MKLVQWVRNDLARGLASNPVPPALTLEEKVARLWAATRVALIDHLFFFICSVAGDYPGKSPAVMRESYILLNGVFGSAPLLCAVSARSACRITRSIDPVLGKDRRPPTPRRNFFTVKDYPHGSIASRFAPPSNGVFRVNPHHQQNSHPVTQVSTSAAPARHQVAHRFQIMVADAVSICVDCL